MYPSLKIECLFLIVHYSVIHFKYFSNNRSFYLIYNINVFAGRLYGIFLNRPRSRTLFANQAAVYLYGESYKSEIRTFSPLANCSSVSKRGDVLPPIISLSVDRGTPVRIATWRIDNFFSIIIFPNNIFISILFPEK